MADGMLFDPNQLPGWIAYPYFRATDPRRDRPEARLQAAVRLAEACLEHTCLLLLTAWRAAPEQVRDAARMERAVSQCLNKPMALGDWAALFQALAAYGPATPPGRLGHPPDRKLGPDHPLLAVVQRLQADKRQRTTVHDYFTAVARHRNREAHGTTGAAWQRSVAEAILEGVQIVLQDLPELLEWKLCFVDLPLQLRRNYRLRYREFLGATAVEQAWRDETLTEKPPGEWHAKSLVFWDGRSAPMPVPEWAALYDDEKDVLYLFQGITAEGDLLFHSRIREDARDKRRDLHAALHSDLPFLQASAPARGPRRLEPQTDHARAYAERFRRYLMDDGEISDKERELLDDFAALRDLTDEEVAHIEADVRAEPEVAARSEDLRRTVLPRPARPPISPAREPTPPPFRSVAPATAPARPAAWPKAPLRLVEDPEPRPLPEGDAFIAIDLGATRSSVAVIDGGRPKVLADAGGARAVPSVVAWNGEGRLLVGEAARRQAAANPANAVVSSLHLVGKSVAEIANEWPRCPLLIVPGSDGEARVVIHGNALSTAEIVSKLLTRLKTIAEAYLGEGVRRAFVTVPAYFDASAVSTVRQAAKMAGLWEARVLAGPAAVALSYGLDQPEEASVAVVDLGGGGCQVGIAVVDHHVVEMMAVTGDRAAGGGSIDAAIVDWLLDGFRRDCGIDLSSDASVVQRLFECAEAAKLQLSEVSEVDITVPFVAMDHAGPRHLKMCLTRERFDYLCAPVLARVIDVCRRVLADAGLHAADIDRVVFVGGASRIPALRDGVRSLFLGKPIARGVDPDQAAALGAAARAGICMGHIKDILVLDVLTGTIGVEGADGRIIPMIKRNTTIPSRHTDRFSPADAAPTGVSIKVYQGESELAADSRLLGRLDLHLRDWTTEPDIEVTIDVDVDLAIVVTAIHKASGSEASVRLLQDPWPTGPELGALRHTPVLAERQEPEASEEPERDEKPAIEPWVGVDVCAEYPRAIAIEKGRERVAPEVRPGDDRSRTPAYLRVPLQDLKQQADRCLGARTHGVVLTVPAAAGTRERQELRRQALSAGWTEVRLLEVAVAAELGWSLATTQELAAVVHLGVGGLSAAVLDCDRRNLRVLALASDPDLRPGTPEAAVARGLAAACRRCLADSGRSDRGVHRVLLAGCLADHPALRDAVQRVFACEPTFANEPEDRAARGAAIMAAGMGGAGPAIDLTSVVPHSYGVETLGGVMTVLVPRNTPVPTTVTEVFSTAEDLQVAVTVKVYEGEAAQAKENTLVGKFNLEGIPPAPRAVPQIAVSFEVDEDGALCVTAEDQATLKRLSVRITAS